MFTLLPNTNTSHSRNLSHQQYVENKTDNLTRECFIWTKAPSRRSTQAPPTLRD